jgi:alkyl sulfatase BDS1-like metallo-beta-lactamase superfamily hydrolase
VNHLVFADPSNEEARALQADALEQMGYQAESGPWRSFYLTGAQELRKPKTTSDRRAGPAGQIRPLPADQLLDSCSVRLNAEAARDVELAITLHVRDEDAYFHVQVSNAVLWHRPASALSMPTLSLDRLTLAKLILDEITLEEADIDGDRTALSLLLPLLDKFEFWFGIVTP